MLSVKQRKRVKELSDKVQQASSILSGFAKEFQESEHPRDNDGKFTSGGGGASSSDENKTPTPNKEEEKAGAGLVRKTISAILAVKGGSFLGGAVTYWLIASGATGPLGAALTGAGVGLYSAGKLYNVLTKAERPTFKSDEDGKKFLEELPKHLSSKQLADLNYFLQSKAKSWGVGSK